MALAVVLYHIMGVKTTSRLWLPLELVGNGEGKQTEEREAVEESLNLNRTLD